MLFSPLLKRLKRGPQVILPKDFGMIVALTGITKKSLAVDAGAGSGWLAVLLGNICKKVVSYEWREDFVELAKANVKRAELKNVKIKHADIFKGIEEKEVDLITLDLADSDKVVVHAAGALKSGGFVVGYLPHAEQVQRFAKACNAAGFRNVFTIECIVREYLVREQGFRPENTGLTHTAYLTFAQKE
ncbi:tRNA (adenine(57)-N(1)/adenine(58)-N(1))-methyltransferase TrmI [Candidatus Gugararchaeum adminiculabundum]|nr:tRNA (adenine(57)-N(1)/adenine(58)-N(1))-methyltransferase TrmI [Candidatus Gugararchaeum adminiculabundum]